MAWFNLRKLKLYIYPNIYRHVPAAIPEYEIPFSERGIREHCEVVSPQDAEFYFCGQFENSNRWLLDANRFQYFDGNEAKHIFDLESDLSNFQPWIPFWIKPSIITAMNALPEHRDWNLLVRPGFSRLLVDLVKREPQPWQPPIRKGFYFRGQRDPHGLREKVRQALILADVPHDFTFTDRWNAPTATNDPIVRGFERETREWSHSLCPGGTGEGMTCRFFEVCGLGRVPVVIARNKTFGESQIGIFSPHMRVDASVEQTAKWLRWTLDNFDGEYSGRLASIFFSEHIRRYFKDPTAYFIGWIESRGLI